MDQLAGAAVRATGQRYPSVTAHLDPSRITDAGCGQAWRSTQGHVQPCACYMHKSCARTHSLFLGLVLSLVVPGSSQSITASTTVSWIQVVARQGEHAGLDAGLSQHVIPARSSYSSFYAGLIRILQVDHCPQLVPTVPRGPPFLCSSRASLTHPKRCTSRI